MDKTETYTREQWFEDRDGYDQDFYDRLQSVRTIERLGAGYWDILYKDIEYTMTDGTVIKERA